MRIDAPEVLAEVRAEFERSESALVANDREALVEFFLDAPATVRYGIDDAQYGHEELAAFRRSQAVATPPRDLRRTVFTTFGRDLPSRTPSSCPTVPTRSAASHRLGAHRRGLEDRQRVRVVARRSRACVTRASDFFTSLFVPGKVDPIN